MPSSRDVALLRQSAAALRSGGEDEAAAELDRAADRLEPTSGHGADLDGVRQGVFRLREGEPEPKPRPPARRADPTHP